MRLSPTKKLLILLLLFTCGSQPVSAISPPPEQLTANCVAPSYASDMLVCEDAGLRELDNLLAALLSRGRDRAYDTVREESDSDWFRRSRLCAFETAHRECLVAYYCARLTLLDHASMERASACGGPVGDYLAAASISTSGFAYESPDVQGREIRLWGYVDHANLYGDDSSKDLLGTWWSGYGPDDANWRFDLKAMPDDSAGKSFAVWIRNDGLRDDVLEVFLADAKANRPTKVYLTGRIFTFEAPTNARSLIGLRMELQSSRDIRFRPPD